MKNNEERNQITDDFVHAHPDPTAEQIAEWIEAYPDCADEIMNVSMLMLATSFRRGSEADHRVSKADEDLVRCAFGRGPEPSRKKDGATP